MRACSIRYADRRCCPCASHRVSASRCSRFQQRDSRARRTIGALFLFHQRSTLRRDRFQANSSSSRRARRRACARAFASREPVRTRGAQAAGRRGLRTRGRTCIRRSARKRSTRRVAPGRRRAHQWFREHAFLAAPALPRNSWHAELASVYVIPSLRKHGFARELCREAVATARARGVRHIVVHPSDGARSLYASLGFSEGNEMRLPA